MGLALLAAAQFPRIPSSESSHHPRVLQGPASPQAGGPRGPLACTVTREGGASRGRLLGCGSRGSAVGGAQRAGEERGGWAAGDGRKEGRTPAAATAAAAARPGRAGTSARRARGPRSPAQPCECHRRFPGPRAVPGMGAALRVPPHRSRICCPGCGPVPHRPIPGTRAARCGSSPPPGRGGRPQKPPHLGLLPSQGKAQAALAPELWGGPGLTAGPRRQPGRWQGRSPGAPPALSAGEAELGMGRGR